MRFFTRRLIATPIMACLISLLGVLWIIQGDTNGSLEKIIRDIAEGLLDWTETR